jgi:excisionase family DNA binding protein
MKTTLTIAEAAEVLGKSVRTIRGWIAAGLLPVIAIRQRTRRLCRDTVERVREGLESARNALSYAKAGEILGLKPETVRRLAAQGILLKVKSPDGRAAVSRRAVERLLGGTGAFASEDVKALVAHTRS